jgi:ribose 5-phosphate isomerase A
MIDSPIEKEKFLAAEHAVNLVENHMIVGLGSGSTVYYFLRLLGERVSKGLNIKGIPTSGRSETIAREVNIPITTLQEHTEIDLTIDGADEFDPQLNLIKGGGGALLREKIVASNSKRMVVIADSAKQVEKLGNFPLPVEVIPFSYPALLKRFNKEGFNPILRTSGGDKPYVTDEGNYIIDCHLGTVDDPMFLSAWFDATPGVVCQGFFINMASKVIMGKGEIVEIIRKSS